MSLFVSSSQRSMSPLTRKSIIARALQGVHAHFAHQIVQTLQEALEAPSVALALLDEMPARDAARQPGLPGWRVPFLVHQGSRGCLEMTNGLARVLADHALDIETPADQRGLPLSDIEAHLLQQMLIPLLAAYAAAWERYTPITCQPGEDDVPSDDEQLYLAAYDVETSRGSGRLYVTLRLATWESILDALAQHPPQIPPVNPRMLEMLGQCMVTASAVLGSTTITVRDLLALREGDIICLGQDPAAPVEVRIGEQPKLLGNVHVENGQFTVTVAQILPGRETPDGLE